MNFVSSMTLKASPKELPSLGVRVAVNGHQQTMGKHRVRFSIDPEVAHILRRGLSSPRLHIDGSLANGLRIWCSETGGMAPSISHAGTWAVTVPVRRVRGRERVVHAMDVAIAWERDETGPVLLIPRVPDALLPEALVDKLPNSQVDHETRMERADARMKRELAMLDVPVPPEEAPGSALDAVEPVMVPEVAAPEPEAVPDLPTPPAEPEIKAPYLEPKDVPPPSAPALDLKEALAMVNELVDQLGNDVILSIDENGHVQAKRRIVAFVDL